MRPLFRGETFVRRGGCVLRQDGRLADYVERVKEYEGGLLSWGFQSLPHMKKNPLDLTKGERGMYASLKEREKENGGPGPREHSGAWKLGLKKGRPDRVWSGKNLGGGAAFQELEPRSFLRE